MNTILEMRGITKTFPGVKALSDVNLTVSEGEIHALVGENGAGKSTLMKVLSGVYPHGSYEGDIIYKGDTQSFGGISDSEDKGIIIIHQELALVPLLSIAENIFLGNERAKSGVINWSQAHSEAEQLLKVVGLTETTGTLVTNLGVGQQQLVEIAKALSKEVQLLILDEPTSSLNEQDSEALLELLLEFKRNGISSILISHKLNEVVKVADKITVLRDGETVSTLDCDKSEEMENRIIKDMVGRELTNRFPPREPKIGETLMEVKNWNAFHPVHSDRQIIKDVNLEVRAGEIVGIAGLMGAGRTELAMSIFGRSYGKRITGDVLLKGQPIDVSTINRAVDRGLAYVTEDRKEFGLVLDNTIKVNTTLSNLDGVSKGLVLDDNEETRVALEYKDKLNTRCSGILQKVVNLSGGNQQKVVLSKWLFANPEVLILDEPTRGIDVNAKFEIYTIINQLAEEGKGVIFISSEMPELLGMTDRIYVMNEGRVVGELPTAEASQEKIMRMIIKNNG
ncbi:multiple monosaccharide ABC transporter ATP-binding protein [Cohaesibacter sp. ES.047]|uniref:multiple monosaccharide ABC transporter ATP-binding protein n=1 Tax=Cohaesibacter sp. ES.047 TaxID=1798205 RepID=UPI000BB9B341|nr:multiple monosaccharide ABC transporter ATP-binding protein [Cohaesibacter sp. ES.047]SNY89920.1 multiple monosaccharide ABC transporter ATP-binding protein [Cohaesibacter sp. ES.047]SNY90728.1 multiple monosaccharide ABC transporter ATP-binding protein [Cohaesibacter sp. ES.047]